MSSESARIARGQLRDIATVRDNELDALIFPGGHGVATVLSNYAEKGVVCEVHPEVARLLKAHAGAAAADGIHLPRAYSGGARARAHGGRAHHPWHEACERIQARGGHGRGCPAVPSAGNPGRPEVE